MAAKRLNKGQDPDYEQNAAHPKKMRSVEENARDATVKQIQSIIKQQFAVEMKNKEKEIVLIDERIGQVRKMLDKLRACVIANYYGDDDQERQLQKSVEYQKGVHPAAKRLLRSSVTTSMAAEDSSKETPAEVSPEEEPMEEEEKVSSDDQPKPSKDALVSSSSSSAKPKLKMASSPSSRFHVKKRVVMGNISKYIPPDKREPNDPSTHKWMVYVRGPSEEPRIDHFVKKVWFFLHPSYRPNDLVEISEAPFHLQRRGWGEFPVRVQLHFVDSRNKKVDIIHHLKLDRTYTGLQTLGAETVVDIELDRYLFDEQGQPLEANWSSSLSTPSTPDDGEVTGQGSSAGHKFPGSLDPGVNETRKETGHDDGDNVTVASVSTPAPSNAAAAASAAADAANRSGSGVIPEEKLEPQTLTKGRPSRSATASTGPAGKRPQLLALTKAKPPATATAAAAPTGAGTPEEKPPEPQALAVTKTAAAAASHTAAREQPPGSPSSPTTPAAAPLPAAKAAGPAFPVGGAPPGTQYFLAAKSSDPKVKDKIVLIPQVFLQSGLGKGQGSGGKAGAKGSATAGGGSSNFLLIPQGKNIQPGTWVQVHQSSLVQTAQGQILQVAQQVTTLQQQGKGQQQQVKGQQPPPASVPVKMLLSRGLKPAAGGGAGPPARPAPPSKLVAFAPAAGSTKIKLLVPAKHLHQPPDVPPQSLTITATAPAKTPEATHQPPPALSPSNYRTMEELVKAAVKHFPLVDHNRVLSEQPYCALHVDQFSGWSVGRRRACEWQRAAALRTHLRPLLHQGPAGLGEGAQPLWSLKQIVHWCRQRGFTPFDDYNFGTQPHCEQCGRITREEEDHQCQHPPSLSGLGSSHSGFTQLLKRVEEIHSTTAAVAGDGVDPEIDIIGTAQDGGGRVKVKTEPAADVGPPARVSYRLPSTPAMQFVSNTAREIGVELKPMLVSDNTFAPLLEETILCAMGQFMSDILRNALAISSDGRTDNRNPGPINSRHVIQSLLGLQSCDFLTNKNLGIENEEYIQKD